MSGYMNGTGGKAISVSSCLLGLPHSRHFEKCFSRHQEYISKKIQMVATEEVNRALDEEIKATIVNAKGLDFLIFSSRLNIVKESVLGLPYHMIWAGSGAPVVITMQVSLVMDSWLVRTHDAL